MRLCACETQARLPRRSALKRMVAAVVRDEGAEEAHEPDGWADLVDEAAAVRALDVKHEAAHADPDGGEDGGKEKHDDRPGGPGPPLPLPEPVIGEREAGDQRARQDSGPGLAGARGDPEREHDRGRREVARHLEATSSARSGGPPRGARGSSP